LAVVACRQELGPNSKQFAAFVALSASVDGATAFTDLAKVSALNPAGIG
jgi:hypothetical protein